MVELLAPAGSPEAVTAAVQSGANAVYLSFEDLTGCRRTENIPNSEFESVVRYCRIRGCRAYLALNIPVREDELNKAAGLALRAQRCGVDAIIVRDLGLFRILRSLLPEMPLFADAHLGFYTPESAAIAQRLGFRRVFLPPDLPLEDIRRMAQCPIETAVWVQTPLCAAACGTCRMSAFAGRESAERGLCSELCREQYTLGGRWDTTPLSWKDRCMLPACRDLIDAGVACLAIGSRERRSEYVSAFTDVWATAIRESQLPAEPELERLERVFLPWGAAKKDLYETAEAPEKIPGETEAVCAEQRRNYTSGEARRVGVSFAVAAKDSHSSVILGAQDTDKTIAATWSSPRTVCARRCTARPERRSAAPRCACSLPREKSSGYPASNWTRPAAVFCISSPRSAPSSRTAKRATFLRRRASPPRRTCPRSTFRSRPPRR